LATRAAGPTDEPVTKLAVLDRLVGSWVFADHTQDGFSARVESRWILNNQFLEIDAQVLRAGHPPFSWRTLIGYDTLNDSYRQWKFTDKGVVSTQEGAWNQASSTLNLSGRTPNGHDSESRLRIIDDHTIEVHLREFLDENQTRMFLVALTLDRVPTTANDESVR
jgi:hypothetical protein